MGSRPLVHRYFIVLFLTLIVLWLHPTTVTSSNDDGDNGDNGHHQDEHNLMGLQIWDTTSSFTQALDGGRLILVIITSPWCDRGSDVEMLAAQAAERIDDVFTSGSDIDIDIASGGRRELAYNSATLLPKPLIGLLSSESASHLLLDGLGPITHFPALKFVLSSTPHNCSLYNHDDDDNETDETDETKIWNYIGPPIETTEDVYDSVMMYWYRMVVSTHISRCEPNNKRKTTTTTKTRTKSKTEISDNNNNNNTHHHNPPIFEFTSQSKLASFMEAHGEHLLRPAQARYQHHSTLFEKEMFEFYTGLQNNDSAIGGIFHPFQSPSGGEDDQLHDDSVNTYTQEIDPYILFVQCRLSKRYSVKEDQSNAKRIFEELAEEMIHRRDVAFFALEVVNAKSCSGWFPSGKKYDGAIAVLRVKRSVEYSITTLEKVADQSFWNHRQTRFIHNITTDWNDLKRRVPYDLFIPAEYSKDEDLVSNLTKLTVIHTTPTVMWFDKGRVAQLAFPKHRTIHTVLFIDMALGHESSNLPTSTKHIQNGWPETLAYSLETERLLLDQQRAIQMFYNAALQYRSQHKDEDVVFLIVPSSETRILTTFGVDLWTPLDEGLFGAVEERKRDSDEEMDHFTCRRESSPMMPIMAVTDASDRPGKQASRYYLCSDDMFAPSDDLFEHGGAMKSFIGDVLDGTAVQFIRSEQTQRSPEHDISIKSNVTVVTGNTFQRLVMEREEEHTMLLMKQSSCGHCKRFSIYWNEFQAIIQALNWSSVINVCKIDVSKNDVPHPQINAWDLPSVYYFPAGSKETPIEMTPKYDIDSIDAQYEYDEGLSWVTSGYDVIEWMIQQGKLDLEFLASLDPDKVISIDEDVATQ